MNSTKQLVRNLGRLREDGQDVRISLDNIDDSIAAIRDDLESAKDLATRVRGLSETAGSLKNITRFLAAAPIVGGVVSRLSPAFDRLQSSANTIASYADTLDSKLKPIRDNLRSLESKVENAESKASVAVANLIAYEGGAQSLDQSLKDAFPSRTPKPIQSVVDELNDILGPTADGIDALTDLLNQADTGITTPLDQLKQAIAPINTALNVVQTIEDRLGPLNEPLQDLNSGLKPFEFIFDAFDFVVNRTLGPIINPILERTGLQDRIDQFTDFLDPLDNLTQPLEDAISGLTADINSLDGGIDFFDSALIDLPDQFDGLDLGEWFSLDAIATGNDLADVLIGSDIANVFKGLGKRDFIAGGDGDDEIDGGKSNDILLGGDGNDIVIGGKGNDKISGGNGDDRLDGKGGKDTITGEVGNDILIGGGGKDTLLGGAGEDELLGGGGKDDLNGGGDRDTLDGGGGKDILDGGAENDILTGGGGRDIFVIAKRMGTDTITDFNQGQDRIRLGSRLSFDQLSFSRQDGNTLIQNGRNTLGILDGFTASLTERDFSS